MQRVFTWMQALDHLENRAEGAEPPGSTTLLLLPSSPSGAQRHSRVRGNTCFWNGRGGDLWCFQAEASPSMSSRKRTRCTSENCVRGHALGSRILSGVLPALGADPSWQL